MAIHLRTRLVLDLCTLSLPSDQSSLGPVSRLSVSLRHNLPTYGWEDH
jgi:hypothetical protein